MPQGNLLHTGYPYMQITQIKHFNKLVISNLHKNFKKLGKRVFKYRVYIKKNQTSFYTVIKLVFYNELLIKGIDLLEPFPVTPLHWGVPVCAGPTQRLEQTHALVQGVKFAVDTTISTLVLCQLIWKVWAGK